MRRRMILFGVLAALALSALSTTTTAAASVRYRPDASIKVMQSRYLFYDGWFTYSGYSAQWRGVRVYNGSGEHQVAQADTQQYGLEKHTFAISIKNRGWKPDQFKLGTYGGFTGDWSIKWFKGTTNVTSAVKNGTYVSPVIQPGKELKLTLKIVGDASLGYLGSVTTTATSKGNAARIDAVKADLKQAIWCYC